jgi:hypothetical protein
MKLAFASAVACLIGLAACSQPASQSAAVESITSSASSFRVGDTMTNGDLQLTVTKVAIANWVGERFAREKAADGGELVVVETAIKNAGQKPISAFELPKVKLVDPTGTEYSEDYGKTAAFQMAHPELDRKMASDLNPDITVTDVAVFEVSKAKFSYDSWFITPGGGTLIAFKPSDGYTVK